MLERWADACRAMQLAHELCCRLYGPAHKESAKTRELLKSLQQRVDESEAGA